MWLSRWGIPATLFLSMVSYFSLSTTEALSKLKSDKDGLSIIEVERRQREFGLNQLSLTTHISPLKILISQFTSFLVVLLLVAAGLSVVVDEVLDAAVIMLIVVLNGVIGFFQEYKAELAIESLREQRTATAIVRRDGKLQEVDSKEVVPGDILLVSEGQKIPADARLLSAVDLQVDESILTGESKPVDKKTKILAEKIVVSDRTNLLFSGTTVMVGKGEAVVYAIGNNTELGKIAQLTQDTQRNLTPLQITLNKLSRMVGILSLLLAIPGFMIGLVMGRDTSEIIVTAIALAVSAIPEGLPIVVTIALAFGIKRMLAKQVLIRRLSAVEALGSTDVICTDKTGTLTENQMTVRHVFASNKKNTPLLLQAMVLCSDATEEIGDPTERALIVYAQKEGQSAELRQQHRRMHEVPFNSKNKYMVTVYELENKTTAFVKGAPEKIIAFCDMKKSEEKVLLEQAKHQAEQGNRLLAFGFKHLKSGQQYKSTIGFTYLGLVALQDPPRPKVAEAIAVCHQAGIRTIMITGDHPQTARAIAAQVGITSEKVITGEEFEALSDERLQAEIKKTNIFARVSPEHKLRILATLQQQKHFVAMTGDGVNDAPALRQADIGVALGSGSDLAKDTADMIILDDNFTSIVDAVYEGRGIFSNIKKTITFLIAVNFDEIFLIAISLILHLPLPLLPIHLLWLNVVTDSFPALALAADPYEKDIMKLKPYNPTTEILKGVMSYSVLAGFLAFVSSFSTFLLELFMFSKDVATAQTMTFTVTVIFELLIIFAVRSRQRLRNSQPLANKWLLLAIAVAVLFQLFAVYFPYTQSFFKTVALSADRWLVMLPFALFGLVGFELKKILFPAKQLTPR